MRTEPRTLEQLYNRRTSYEIVLTIHGESFRIGFSERKTRDVLISASRSVADVILPHVPEGLEWRYRAGTITWAPGVTVGFSGRTEREIASHG